MFEVFLVTPLKTQNYDRYINQPKLTEQKTS